MFEFESKHIETSTDKPHLYLVLTGDVNIADISQLKTIFLEAFDDNQYVVADVAQVTNIDFSVMQLFCATNKYAQKNGKRFELKHQRTKAVIDKALSLGFLRDKACSEAKNPLQCLWIPENMTS